MIGLIKVENSMTFVTSKDVADNFGKENKHVMRDIRSILKNQPEFGESNFGLSTYISKQNKELECYNISRDGFAILAMGFTGEKAVEWKIKYINAFNAMESELRSQSENKSSMQLLNEATKMMECDKAIASGSGKQLNEWKKKKKEHIASIKKLVDDAQLKLGFDI